MPGNDFEKQVQQKMDELYFVPSDAVWPEVEKQIARRKKRRVLFLLLPFLLLLMGGAAWVYNAGIKDHNNKKQVTEKSIVAPVTGTDKKENNSPGTRGLQKEMKQSLPLPKNMTNKQLTSTNSLHTDNSHNNNVTALKNRPDENSIVHERTNLNEAGTMYSRKNKKHPAAARARNSTINETQVSVQASKKNPDTKKVEETVVPDETLAALRTENQEVENNKEEQVLTDRHKSVADAPVTDSVTVNNPFIAKADIKDSISIKNSNTDSTRAIAKTKPAGNKNKKITWGISMNAGLSNASAGFSGLFSSSASYDMFSFANTQNSNNAGVGFTRPSDIKRGFAYSAGIFISKPFGKNLRLLAGLNYSYYSTSIEVGAKIDSNKSAVQYRTGNAAAYTNRFHFIELPVIVEKQLGAASRFSVNGGMFVSMLAGSNALQYDAQKNIYYADNSRINKTQFGLLAGVNYRLLEKSFRIETGPQFNYNLTSLFAKDVYGNGHLFFVGLNTRIFFQKK